MKKQVIKFNSLKLSPTNHLKEADQVGEDEEGGGVVDPLEEAKEDEGPTVDDEAGRKYRLHSPY